MNQATKGKEKLFFPRVLVEVGLKQDIPDTIEFCNEYGTKVQQKAEFEWRPIKCTKCSGFGH